MSPNGEASFASGVFRVAVSSANNREVWEGLAKVREGVEATCLGWGRKEQGFGNRGRLKSAIGLSEVGTRSGTVLRRFRRRITGM